MFRSNSINLSESNVTALEAVRQALKIALNFNDISFTGNLQIDPQPINKFGENTRTVAINGYCYDHASGSDPIHFSATIQLIKKIDCGWAPQCITSFLIGELYEVWCWCRADWTDKAIPQVTTTTAA